MRFELQRADFWKRISAFLLDVILLWTVIVGVALAMSAIFKYDKYFDSVERIENEYVEKYGVDPDLTEEEFAALSDEEKDVYYKCDEERKNDARLVYAYNMIVNLALSITSVSILLGYVIMELIIPIFFKNGQTLGKKAFGLGVVHTNGVRLHGQAHFVRVIIGKCVIETMVPAYLILMILFGNLGMVGAIVLLLLLGLQIFALIYTKTRSSIHDLISDTVVVDYASQMVFENADELIAYKQKLHEEMANKQEY